MGKLFNSIWYRLFVFAIVMPINGVIISRGGMGIFLGVLLILLQLPAAATWFKEQ